MLFKKLVIGIFVCLCLIGCNTLSCGCSDASVLNFEQPDTMRLLNACIADFDKLKYWDKGKGRIFVIRIESSEKYWIVEISLEEERYETLIPISKNVGKIGEWYSDFIIKNGCTYFIADKKLPFTEFVYQEMMRSGLIDDKKAFYIIYELGAPGQTYVVCKNNYAKFKRYENTKYTLMRYKQRRKQQKKEHKNKE